MKTDDIDAAELGRKFDAQHAEVKSLLEKAGLTIDGLTKNHEGLKAELSELAQFVARRKSGGDSPTLTTPGGLVVADTGFKQFGGSTKRGKFQVNVKSITSAAASAGAFVQADHVAEPAMNPRRRFRVRDLLSVTTTHSNAVEFVRQTTRTNAAAPVAEGGTKPESDYAWELITSPVRTIAHWVPASKQVLDDSGQLQNAIDGELRYGLQLEEDDQLLLGDGTGQNLTGIIPLASDYSPNIPNATAHNEFDTLLRAIAQLEENEIAVDGIVVHPRRLRKMLGLKDSNGQYLASTGPFAASPRSVWDIPWAATTAIEYDEFLVGGWRLGATIHDREDAMVEVSTEDSDNFRKNMVTVRAEQRLTLTVRRPDHFLHGAFGDAS